ncbi:hypothetical protein O6H91_13G016800 [Diphasiastrum complanatum]|uniref:Uncharacterized protein n=1 Tax=Diphasiastrum complanatum TaxID=34168 RepID=A0ACC2BSK9_DIPCM|nr:hypothetical protein O6H91_13G016800 [Diphasiastrum complanatum]
MYYVWEMQAMAHHLGLPNDSVHLVGMDSDLSGILWMSDVVVYGSSEEEKLFPPILVRAMGLERPIIAPSFTVIKQNLCCQNQMVGGLLYPAGDDDSLGQSLLRLTQSTPEELSGMITAGRLLSKNLLAMDAVTGYSRLLEIVLDFPSQILLPQPVSEVQDSFKSWQWDLLTSHKNSSGVKSLAHMLPSEALKPLQNVDLDLIRKFSTEQSTEISTTPSYPLEINFESLEGDEWDDDRAAELRDEIERMEEEELEERKEQSQAIFEDVNRGVKKAEREKDEIHERDDAELERTGQPLCIYESYQGSGAWPFLHQGNPLYRGLSLSLHGRRPKFDDIDAPSRLPLLNDTYYRDVLCDFGAFLAIANRLDRIHKNAWIGFQPWYAAGRKVGLSYEAEHALANVVTKGKDGDAVYFWAHLGMDVGGTAQNTLLKPHEDFWLMCDALNAGNCRSVFLDAFRQMYGLPVSWKNLPPMPASGGLWAAMHCWAMPTSSYMEFIMFSRLFLDALDSQLYEEHHENGRCCLGISMFEVQHCYCHLLEVLINVWAYHSARRMIYIDPVTGLMQEQHFLKSRRGILWIKWFSFSMLKAIDEEFAERADDEHPEQRWLWPHTGEVFWQGILERERQERYALKIERKRRNKERLARMRSRYKQKSLGRYVKPPPGAGYVPQELEDVNSESEQHLQVATE